MTPQSLAETLEQAEPDAAWPPPLQALWWLQKGGLAVGPEYRRAHAICQRHEGDLDHDRVHALVHWVEGDMGNAAYWYGRVGDARAESLEAEWARLVELIGREA